MFGIGALSSVLSLKFTRRILLIKSAVYAENGVCGIVNFDFG
jgi:hypothetical protein